MWSRHRHGQLLEEDTIMKKILFVTIALALVGGILAGCSGEAAPAGGEKAGGEKAPAAGDTKTPEAK